MITIFSIPKPFTDPHIRLIQRNAIQSWKALGDNVEIILLGSDAGVAEVAREFSVSHIPNVAVNEFGTPMLDSAFSLVRVKAKNNILLYANSDNILLPNILDAIIKAPAGEFLMCGQRTDLDITREIDFKDSSWQEKLNKQVRANGKLHSPAGMDYFIFRRESFADLPNFAVGRIGWDVWMVYNARRKHMPVIDLTTVTTVIHQNHGYSGNNVGAHRKINPEALKNLSYVGPFRNRFTIEDATYKMTEKGLVKNTFYWLPYLKRSVKGFFGKA